MTDAPPDAEALMVLTNVPPANADALARHCVASGLAACVNLLPPMASVYRWQGKVETATEQLLLIKTSRAAFPKLEAAIHALHPYELPEIISVPLGPSSPRYLQWLLANVSH
jgi:periplasmic divalent cation tolerance protein